MSLLTDRQTNLLYELYGLPFQLKTITLGETGLSSAPPLTDLFQSAKDRLREAIGEINLEPDKVARVGEILAEYEGLSLDPSKIDRDGYSFKFRDSIQNLKERLYPYTGIRVPRSGGGRGNRVPLG